MDETGYLQEGQVFVITEQHAQSSYQGLGRPIIGGKQVLVQNNIAITRSPAMHPGDVQLVNAVDVPEDSPLPQDAHILPPPHVFWKINIDRAFKGNPGMAGFGGVIRDEQGCIKDIFHSHLGTTTNNMAELMALEQCLEILMEANLHNTIIESDSELVINVAKKMCNRTACGKVSKHWRLL